uniref:Uncharacterized protein n=1 Tax=Schistocephalus solidus TaxID=70667 RepID=A0A0X3NU66_SCHSO
MRAAHRESLRTTLDNRLQNRTIGLPHARLDYLRGFYDRVELKWNALQSTIFHCPESTLSTLRIQDYFLHCASTFETRLQILRQDWCLHQPLPDTFAAIEKRIDQFKGFESRVNGLEEIATGLEYLAHSFLIQKTLDGTAVNSRLKKLLRSLSNLKTICKRRSDELHEHRAYLDCRDSQAYSALRFFETSLQLTYLEEVQHDQNLIDGHADREFATLTVKQTLNKALRLTILLEEIKTKLQDIGDSLEMDVNFWPMGDRAEYEALRPHNMQLSTNVFFRASGDQSTSEPFE